MTKSEMVDRLNEKQAWLPGKRIKFDFGAGGVVMIDGVSGHVSEEDGDADTSIVISWEDLEALRRKELDPMTALMQGRLGIQGDMANAMQLASLTSKLQG
jgi:putative sterol carrier protein